ncbi:MAG: sirohydrochlorin chelatase [Sphingomonadaceae bacterium]
MRTVILLAMHGAPPKDFPKRELGEYFGLRTRLQHSAGPDRAEMERRHAELEAKMLAWPRTAQNDPYYAAAQALAAQLRATAESEVVVAFNEFCAPTLDEAMDHAMALSPDRVVVITPMMTRGGEHSEVDIPEAVRRAQGRYPSVPIVYAWPFDVSDIARFLTSQIHRFLEQAERG